MIASDLSTDGAVAFRTLVAPERGLSAVAVRHRAAVALAIATAVSLATAAVVLPRVEHGSEPIASERGSDDPEPTPYEREQAAATAHKLGQIRGWAGAARRAAAAPPGRRAGAAAPRGPAPARARWRPGW